MPAIKNNLSVDFKSNYNSSKRSTKKIDLSRSSIYAIDDIFNLKYFSKTTVNKKSTIYISTIKLEFKEKQSITIENDDYDFFDINTRRRVLIKTTNDSEIYGIRIKQSKLLKSIAIFYSQIG